MRFLALTRSSAARAALDLVSAMLLEQNDEWCLQRRYMQLEAFEAVSDNPQAKLSAGRDQLNGELSGQNHDELHHFPGHDPRRSRHSPSSLLARHHESGIHRRAAWTLGAGASLDLRQMAEFRQRLGRTGEAGSERNWYRIGTGLNIVHLAPFSHKAFDSNSAILQNASVSRGKTLAQPTTYKLLVSLNVKTSLSILSLLLLLTGTATLPSTAAAQPPAQVQRDPSKLHLASGSALLIDLNSNKELYSNHADRVVPIASVTKLMTAMVVLDAKLPMDEMLTMTIANNPEMKGVYSRVRLGSLLDRRETLLITLMSSENRAANSLANAYPGGYPAFIKAMNAKARSLGMAHTRYVEPTGLSTQNVSTARDLAKLLMASRKYPMLSELSTTREKTVAFRKPNYTLGFRNTDHLVNKSNWDIKLTKTGFTNEAGHCLVLLTRMDNRPVAMVILDAFGKYTHFADASRMRQWLETGTSKPAPAVAMQYKAERQNKGRLAVE